MGAVRHGIAPLFFDLKNNLTQQQPLPPQEAAASWGSTTSR
jgi:hypothetical protein